MHTRHSPDLEPDTAIIPARRRYDTVSMTLHWVTLLLIVTLYATMWAHEQARDGETGAGLLTWHRSVGVLFWAVTLFRLSWKKTAAKQPPLPSTMLPVQRLVARANEYALYALLLIQPLTGFEQSIARGKDFPLLGLTFPSVMARDKTLTHLFHDIHETSATVLLVLIGLHACAALFHGLVLRDGVLSAMVPSKKIATAE